MKEGGVWPVAVIPRPIVLQQLFEPLLGSGKVRALDLVEVNPEKDNGKTLELAKRIVDFANNFKQ